MTSSIISYDAINGLEYCHSPLSRRSGTLARVAYWEESLRDRPGSAGSAWIGLDRPGSAWIGLDRVGAGEERSGVGTLASPLVGARDAGLGDESFPTPLRSSPAPTRFETSESAAHRNSEKTYPNATRTQLPLLHQAIRIPLCEDQRLCSRDIVPSWNSSRAFRLWAKLSMAKRRSHAILKQLHR